MLLLGHVHEVFFAVVERISVGVMTDQAEWCPGHESMHRDIDFLSAPGDSGFCVPAAFVPDRPPFEFLQGLTPAGIYDNDLSVRQQYDGDFFHSESLPDFYSFFKTSIFLCLPAEDSAILYPCLR